MFEPEGTCKDDFVPETHFNALKQTLQKGWESPGFQRLRKWIDGVVFERQPLDFLNHELESGAAAAEEYGDEIYWRQNDEPCQ